MNKKSCLTLFTFTIKAHARIDLFVLANCIKTHYICMTMAQIFDISAKADQKLEQLRAILYLLQSNLEEFKEDVDRSYELLQVGEFTYLTKKIDDTLANPTDGIFEIPENIDNQVKYILDKYVKSFLQINKTLIQSAYRSKTSLNDLHYSIVLQEDTMENRSKIFHFFEIYDLLDIATKYPIYFQFVPAELLNKVSHRDIFSIYTS